MRTTVLHRKNTGLTADVTAAATTFYVKSTSDLPTVPWLGIMNAEESSPEVVLVTAHNTTTNPRSITVVRAALGTTAKIHLEGSTIRELGQKQVAQALIADVSTGETIYIPLPKCFVLRIVSILQGTISGADADIVFSKNATELGTITIGYDGSAAGDWDEVLSDGDAIADWYFDGVDDFLMAVADGASTDAAQGQLMVEYIPY